MMITLKCSKLENKSISSSIGNWTIIYEVSGYVELDYFGYSNSQYNEDICEMVITISYIILKASSAPNCSIEEKLRSQEKCPNTAKKNNKKKPISVPISEDRWKYKWKSD